MKPKLKISSSRKKIKRDDFVDPLDSDLSQFIEGAGWQPVRFELKEKKDRVVSLRMSDRLFNAIRGQARAMGLDTQKFIRLSLESVTRESIANVTRKRRA